jgi:hypothetical protein
MILFLPAILEGIFVLIIPSQTNLVNQFGSNIIKSGIYDLEISNYGSFNLPYHLNGTFNLLPAKTLISNFYTPTNRPGIQLIELSNENVSNYVLDKRKYDIKYLVNDFFIGMKLNITSDEKLYATMYYNSLALHSSAIAVNEISNLLLAFLTRNYKKSISTINSPLSSNNSLYTGDDFLQYLACMDVLPVSVLNMLNSVIVSLIISFMVINISRERINGSKSLQYITRTNFVTYWLSNYLFDLVICFFNLTSMIVVLKLVDLIRNDPTNESYPIASNSTLAYVLLLFLLSSFSWCTFAYIWSFFFKTDLIGFISLAIILGVAGFLDMVWSFIQLFVNLDVQSSSQAVNNLMNVLRYIFLFTFPNVTIKRGLYNLKIRQNKYCINSLNNIIKSKLG